jgi:hypothetical protein
MDKKPRKAIYGKLYFGLRRTAYIACIAETLCG